MTEIARARASTIEDVAQLAGVSIKTVSRVVNREPNVREKTRALVEQAITQLNYRPNVSARNLASQQARLIVLIYDDPSFYEVPSANYIINLQAGALAVCKKLGYELLIHPCNFRDRQMSVEIGTLLRRVRASGVIVAPPLSNMAPVVDTVADSDIPFVLLSPGSRRFEGFAVHTTDRSSCAKMTEYLASEGHKRIAFIRGNPKHKAVAQRFAGYKDGLKAAGLPFDPALVVRGDNSIGSGEICAEELLGLPSPPTAIFAANDDMAAGVLRTANRLGIAVPKALSIAGCDDIALAQQVFPSLTTIRQPLDDMAAEATRLLIEESRKQKTFTGSRLVPGELKIRESTGPAPR
jgi:LacI family transcriptional regulator